MQGAGKGRRLGFRTANLSVEHLSLPPMGVYAVKVCVENHSYMGVANLGYAPTLHNDRPPVLEVHILDYDNDLTEVPIEVIFLKHLRPEKKFTSAEDLKIQIQKDIHQTRSFILMSTVQFPPSNNPFFSAPKRQKTEELKPDPSDPNRQKTEVINPNPNPLPNVPLPDDILQNHIFFYLKPDDLGSALKTCHQWNRVASRDAVWQQFAVNLGLDPIPMQFKRRYVELMSQIKSKQLKSTDLGTICSVAKYQNSVITATATGTLTIWKGLPVTLQFSSPAIILEGPICSLHVHGNFLFSYAGALNAESKHLRIWNLIDWKLVCVVHAFCDPLVREKDILIPSLHEVLLFDNTMQHQHTFTNGSTQPLIFIKFLNPQTLITVNHSWKSNIGILMQKKSPKESS